MSERFRPLRGFAPALALATLTTGAALLAQGQQNAPRPAPAAPATFNANDVIPFDPAVRTATLPNGVKVFVRRNQEPEKRASLRLAVKAGSMMEADDQQGLAHLIEHMAFNGSAHFKPGELVSTFETVGARLGPHVNAYTSFDETVYMLDLPTNQGDILTKGVTAMADFAGGLTLDPSEIDKERGVVVEEWRGGLGAGTRIRDKQFPVLFNNSRYAQRLPIGKPEIIRGAPAARLRAFYDTWYRTERIAIIAVGDFDASAMEQTIRTAFAPLADRAPAAPEPDRAVPLNAPLMVNVADDPEVTRSSVQLVRKRPHQDGQKVSDYRRNVVERLMSQMMNERFGELARRPDAAFLGAGAGGGSLAKTVDSFSLSANAPDGRIPDALSSLVVEARRVRQFGFNDTELARVKSSTLAYMERAYNERDKTESESFAQEYISFFLEDEPSPGITYEYRLMQALLPTITNMDISALARTLLTDDNRVVLAVSPQKAGVRVPTEAELRAALTSAESVAVMPWADATVARELVTNKPAPAGITSRREDAALGMTIVRFANGVEAWFKPTNFKNDQVIFTMQAQGGVSLAPCSDIPEATLATSLVRLSGIGGIKALDLQKMLAGKIASASPSIDLSTQTISGSAAPAELETALQLLYQSFVAPNDDPDAFALLTRQLSAAVANREQSPQQVFGEKMAEMNMSGHCTTRPLTVERVAALDRAKMVSFYKQRFSNAADFTFFMVGAFKVDEALPLVARYVGSLPSTGQATSKFVDLGIKFPDKNQQLRVAKGREPRAQTVLSFFADPPPTPQDQEYVLAATTVLDIALRDVLREELGQTYTVGVGLSQPLPQRGSGRIQISFGSAPENAQSMTDRVIQEIKQLQQNGPSVDLTNRAKETARRGYEEALRDNGYWLRRLGFVRLIDGDPNDILTRNQRIDKVTPEILKEIFQKDFPFDRYTVATLVPEQANN